MRAYVFVIAGVCTAAVGCERPLPPSLHPCACFKPPAEGGQVLATVGKHAITAVQLQRRWQAQLSPAPLSVASLQTLLDDEIRFELMAQAARERGLEQDPEVIDAARRVMVRKLLQRDLDPAAFESSLGDRALWAYYQAHPQTHMHAEQRRYAQITLAPNEQGRAFAERLVTSLKKEGWGAFVQAAARYSLDTTTRGRAGETSFVDRATLTKNYGASFADAVFAAPQAGVLLPNPIRSNEGWHVVTLLAVRAAQARPFAEVREALRDQLLLSLQDAHQAQYVEALRRLAPVTIHPERLTELLQAQGKL